MRTEDRLTTEAALEILRQDIPKEHAITISAFDYRHVSEVTIVSGFQLAKGKHLTSALVSKALKEWRKLMKP